jgi:hypothetical protein
VGATVTHGHTEALGTAEHHVGTQFAGDLSSSRESMSVPTQASPSGLDGGNEGTQIGHIAGGPGYWNMAPNTSSLTASPAGPTTTSKPKWTAPLDHVDHLG